MGNDDLLRPTLSDYRKPPSLYNSTGFFLSAFFGGPMGAGVYATANAWRLSRLSRDLPVFVVTVAAAYLLLIESWRLGWTRQLGEFLDMSSGRAQSIVVRALGLACFGAFFFVHRTYFRSAQVSGVTPIAGWKPGIAAVLAGWAANIAMAALIEHH